MHAKSLASLFAAPLIALAALVPSPATAAGQDGVRESGEFIFYFNSGYAGSWSDFAASKGDLAGYTFLKSGLAGYTELVKRNSASVENNRNQAARVYFSSNYAGASDYVDPLGQRNLVNTYNENASFRWV